MLLALPFGLAIGLTLGMLGGGGAVLAVPVLVYVLDQDVHTATTASLAVVAVAALTGGVGQASRREVCWPQVAVFAPAAVAGTAAGTAANQAVSGRSLLIAFSLVLFAAAAVTWRKAARDAPEGAGACPPLRTRRTLGAGLAVGALTGFFGVGGGFLVVPLLALGMRFPLRRAIGTSLFIVAFVSLVSLGAHLAQGASVDAGVTGALAGACVIGAACGSRLGARVPQRVLGRAFATLVAAVGAYVLAANLL